MKSLKKILAIMLAVCFIFAFGCAKGPIKTMRNYLKDNGVYDAEVESYTIELSSKVDYYCYKDRDNVWLNYSEYSSGKWIFFYIHFDNEGLDELCYDYSLDYGTSYTMYGHIYPELYSASTDSLSYDSSRGELGSAYENLLLSQLAASYAKIVLSEFKIHLTAAGNYVTLTELGFVNID